MKRIILLLLAVTLLASCDKEAKETEQNGEFTIEYLFEKNGCKMYRFEDCGRYIYWCDCQGKVNSDYTILSGKSTVTHHVESITSE